METNWIDATTEQRQALLAEQQRERDDLFKRIRSGQVAKDETERNAAAQNAEAQRVAEQREAQLRREVLNSYVTANGSAAGFEVVYPDLRAKLVEQRTLTNVGNAASSADVIERFLAGANAQNGAQHNPFCAERK